MRHGNIIPVEYRSHQIVLDLLAHNDGPHNSCTKNDATVFIVLAFLDTDFGLTNLDRQCSYC